MPIQVLFSCKVWSLNLGKVLVACAMYLGKVLVVCAIVGAATWWWICSGHHGQEHTGS